MRRRDLLKGLAVVPALSMFGSALSDKKKKAGRPGPAGILRIVLNGPFAMVLDQKQPDKISFFCPIDPDKLHRFYLNSFAKPYDDGQDPKRTYHFELPNNGLDIYSKKRAYIDQCFRDITFHTDVWQKEPYFVTLELPIPDSIGFVPPAQSIVFKRGMREGSMPVNNVLEYKMTDPDDVKIVSQQGKLEPRPLRKLSDEYDEHCRSYTDGSHKEACSEFDHRFRSWDEPDVRTFVFGIGLDETLPSIRQHEHALKFYNDVLLRSFPKAKDQQELAEIGKSGSGRTPTRGAMLLPAVLDQTTISPFYRPVTAIMDCKINGPHALLP
jgi:hypothetical protein